MLAFTPATSIIVDDSDPAIQYDGGWSVLTHIQNSTTFWGFGEPIFDTLHVMQVFNGTLSYIFTGKCNRSLIMNSLLILIQVRVYRSIRQLPPTPETTLRNV